MKRFVIIFLLLVGFQLVMFRLAEYIETANTGFLNALLQLQWALYFVPLEIFTAVMNPMLGIDKQHPLVISIPMEIVLFPLMSAYAGLLALALTGILTWRARRTFSEKGL